MHALWNSTLYHGWGKKRRFFEGWYYKLVSSDAAHAIAIIPGVAMDEKGEKQAFIQVLDGRKQTAEYHKYKISDFFAHPTQHDVLVGTSRFSLKSIELDLPALKGELKLGELYEWPSSWYSPGIMGPFSFVPRMECYHGIVSMNHSLSGSLVMNGEEIDFTGGRGYIEKDWGHSFPSAYIWMQSNHFSEEGISIKASVAKIPWMGSSFVGFIGGVLIHGKLVQFTTYNFSKLRKCAISDHHVEIRLENRRYVLEIDAERAESTVLASPIGGFMDGRISETMNAVLHVKLYDKRKKKYLLDDSGRSAGLEVAGKIEELLKD